MQTIFKGFIMGLDLSINVQVESYHLTHNLCELCSKVPVGKHKKYISVTEFEYEELNLYDVLWRGDEHNLDTPSDMKEYLLEGLNYLEKNYNSLSKYNPDNGWGHIDRVIKVVEALIKDASIYPGAYLQYDR